jgi:hypothetical protein
MWCPLLNGPPPDAVTKRNGSLEQGVALRFEHAADDRTGPSRAPAHHFVGENIDLPPAVLPQEADRGALPG